MAGALGLLLGLGLGAAKGYAGEKLQKEHQSEAAWHDFMSNAINQHPEIAGTEEGQKQIAQIYGKEHAPIVTGFLQAASHQKQQATDQYKMAENTTIAPRYNAQGVKLPDTPEAIQSEMAILRKSMENGSLPKEYHDAGNQHLAVLQKEHDRLQTQQFQAGQRQQYDSPEAKGAIKNAQIAAETSPANVAAEARRASAITGAQVAQRLKGVKPEEHFATAQAQLQSLSPLERTKAINALYQQNYSKADKGPKVVPDPANPGKYKLRLATDGDSKPSIEEFARAYGVDMRTGGMVSDAGPAAPNGGSSASAPAAAAPAPRAAPEINIPGRGKGTLSGTTPDGRPIYAFPDGSKLAVKAASMRKAGLSGGPTGASVSGR